MEFLPFIRRNARRPHRGQTQPLILKPSEFAGKVGVPGHNDAGWVRSDQPVRGEVRAGDEKQLVLEPLRRIAINAGQDGSVIVQEVKTLAAGQGYDAARDEFGDMLQRGIIDPLKVTRSALENAVSIAGMVLTTNCLVTDIPEGGRAAAAPSMY